MIHSLLKWFYQKKINDNVELSLDSNLDVKNNYDPYESTFRMGLLMNVHN